MALPTALDSSHQSKIDKLKSLKGADFSSRYESDQVSGHKDAVSLFERYAKGGDHPKLKEWADASDAAPSSRNGPGSGSRKNGWKALEGAALADPTRNARERGQPRARADER